MANAQNTHDNIAKYRTYEADCAAVSLGGKTGFIDIYGNLIP
jgi:hypothetical protein